MLNYNPWRETPLLFLEIASRRMAMLYDLYDVARRYFSLDYECKLRDSAVGYNGYRGFGAEFSQSRERPDVKESFVFQSEFEYRPTPMADDLHQRLRHVTTELESDVYSFFHDLLSAYHLGVGCAPVLPATRKASWSQVNYYEPANSTQEYMQECHEDGHFLTFVHGTSPGLEAFDANGRAIAVPPRADGFYVMPGYAMYLLTGGVIHPQYHQVRNHADWSYRMSFTYFLHPDVNQVISPWMHSSVNAGIDIAAVASALPALHGLPSLSYAE